jgi:hypothetical protein
LLDLKKRLGYDDVRFHRGEDCDLCGNNTFGRGFQEPSDACACHSNGSAPSPAKEAHAGENEALVQLITDQVMATLRRSKASA